MMNRETQILQMIGMHPCVIHLRRHFYSTTKGKATGADKQGHDGYQPDKKFLNLVTDFMPLTLSKYNQLSRDQLSVCGRQRILMIKKLMW